MAFVDQTGRTVFLSGIPQRIISLVPSQTELLSDLGLDEEVIGITKFCIHPGKWFHTKKRIGGTKQVHQELICQLQPDLIIANKEENVKEQVEALAALFPVWITDVNNISDAYRMIHDLGMITGKSATADTIIEKVKQSFSVLKIPAVKPRIAYLIWRSPYMTVGHDTFIHSMLELAGYENVFADRTRYPEVSVEELQNAGCDQVFLSSEPYPFGQKHIDELQPLLPGVKIRLADGEMFSWYGSRLLYAAEYFHSME
ncbi:MAG: cobalamin-binding protein [Citrobacter freundii]|nr:MAG: cobalamin-binding protein [Citrobacter freundii]